MASTDSLDSQPCTSVSETVLAAPFEISEMVANAVIEALKAHLGPLELSFKTIPFTVILMVLGAYLLEKLIRTTLRERHRGLKESPEFWQLCKEELEKDREECREVKEKRLYTRGTPLKVTSVDSFEVVRARSGSR